MRQGPNTTFSGTGKYLLLACVDDRRELLEPCLDSIKEFLSGWTLVVVAQCFEAGYLEDKLKGLDYVIIYHDERQGMHNAKLDALRHIRIMSVRKNYIVCSIDDDMQFGPDTHLDDAATLAVEPSVGLISAGWTPHESRYEKQKKSMKPEYVKQPIVYTGGGLIFDNHTADVIEGIGEGDLLCDNSEWSLASYLSGRTNYRYRGSLTIHRICRKGGRKGWVDDEERQRPDPKYLPFRAGKTNGVNHWLIGASGDLTPLALKTHSENRKHILQG